MFCEPRNSVGGGASWAAVTVVVWRWQGQGSMRTVIEAEGPAEALGLHHRTRALCQAQARPQGSQAPPLPAPLGHCLAKHHCDLLHCDLVPGAEVPWEGVLFHEWAGRFWQEDQVSPMPHSEDLLVWWLWLWLRPLLRIGWQCGLLPWPHL